VIDTCKAITETLQNEFLEVYDSNMLYVYNCCIIKQEDLKLKTQCFKNCD